MALTKDLTAQRFGRLVVLQQLASRKSRSWWRCKCDCGSELDVEGAKLYQGRTRSCGCLKREMIGDRSRTHGKRHTPEYASWWNMIQRCTNKKLRAYKDYGGRGITVAAEFQTFAGFYAALGDRPAGCSLERINNDGPYSPANVRWADDKAQARNKRNSRLLTFNGKTQTTAAWCEELGLKPATVCLRLKCGWSMERVLSVTDARKK
jgi:hypothetical protein